MTALTAKDYKLARARAALVNAMSSSVRNKMRDKVKPLEWEQTGNGWRVGQFGQPVFYQVTELADGGYLVSGISGLPRYEYAADAMVACELHHHAFVRSLLAGA